MKIKYLSPFQDNSQKCYLDLWINLEWPKMVVLEYTLQYFVKIIQCKFKWFCSLKPCYLIALNFKRILTFMNRIHKSLYSGPAAKNLNSHFNPVNLITISFFWVSTIILVFTALCSNTDHGPNIHYEWYFFGQWTWPLFF